MKVLDLFSGIGGFALAFEAAGFQTVAFAEIEPYPCKVLAQHWPEVPNLGDVRTIDGRDFAGVDVVCGGFPCQDISTAGKGAGIHGARSGLWFEMLRIVRGSRPAFCLFENVPALRTRGADVVLKGLEEAGYACRAFVVGAGNAGAPHQRARAWLVAYDKGQSLGAPGQPWERSGMGTDRNNDGRKGAGLSGCEREALQNPGRDCAGVGVLDADRNGKGSTDASWSAATARPYWRPEFDHGHWWATEPAMGRVVHGVSKRAHRIKALGNSIVPAVAYPFALWIGMQLMASASERGEASEPQQDQINT